MTYPKGLVEDVLIKVEQFILLADFLVFDMEEDRNIPILLRRHFLGTAGALVDVKDSSFEFRMIE